MVIKVDKSEEFIKTGISEYSSKKRRRKTTVFVINKKKGIKNIKLGSWQSKGYQGRLKT